MPELRARAGVIASHALGHPSQAMTVIGITGTNGKTSISHWLAQAFSLLDLGRAAGHGGNGFIGRLTAATHTTPDPVTVQHKLAEYRAEGRRWWRWKSPATGWISFARQRRGLCHGGVHQPYPRPSGLPRR